MAVDTVNGKSGVVTLNASEIPATVPTGITSASNTQAVIDALAIAAGFVPPTEGDPGSPGTAIRFDGATYLSKATALTGAVPGKQFTGSFRFKGQQQGATQRILSIGAGKVTIDITNTGGFLVTGRNSSGTTIVTLSGSASQLALGTGGLERDTWYWVMFSFDLTDTAKRWIAIDRTQKTVSWTNYVDDNIAFDFAGEVDIGASVSPSLFTNASISDPWFAQTYLPFTLPTLNLFDLAGTPIDLGDEGQFPTGDPALIYLSGTPATWATNDGSGGGFDVAQGALIETIPGPGGVVVIPEVLPIPAHFDGLLDWLSVEDVGGGAVALAGVSDSKLVTVSFDVRPALIGSATRTIFSIGDDRFAIELSDADTFSLKGKNSAGTVILLATLASSGLLDATEHNVLLSLDMASSSNRYVYIDGVAQTLTWTTYTNAAINFSHVGCNIGSKGGGADPYAGDLLRLWANIGTFLTDTAPHLALFYDGSDPVSVGTNGELPLGTVPTIFVNSPVSTFSSNLGSSSEFVEHGVLADGVTWP